MNRQGLGQGRWKVLDHLLYFDNMLIVVLEAILGRDVHSAENWAWRNNLFAEDRNYFFQYFLTTFPLILGSRLMAIASDRAMNLFIEVAMKAGFCSGLKWKFLSIAKRGPNTADVFCISFLQQCWQPKVCSNAIRIYCCAIRPRPKVSTWTFGLLETANYEIY